MLLDGKQVVVTGVLTESSIAASVAKVALAEGATCIFTTPARTMPLTRRTVAKLDGGAEVLPLEVTDEQDIRAVVAHVAARYGRVDGLLHSIAFAPPACLGRRFTEVGWDDAATALRISCYSLTALTRALAPLMPAGAAVVALDFDGSRAWPRYNWMGVSKAALASSAQYLAAELGPKGIRVNLVSSGPLRSLSARAVTDDFEGLELEWVKRAPLGWATTDPLPTARACVALLSDWFPSTTAERIHVDGGFHAFWGVEPEHEELSHVIAH
jgi:enoyl ACP reductase